MDTTSSLGDDPRVVCFLWIADTGTLEAGKSAGLIVLDANPLDDIANTRRISAVVLRGTAVGRAKPVR
jgi:imidazolonepropionase-like amidohydrolase